MDIKEQVIKNKIYYHRYKIKGNSIVLVGNKAGITNLFVDNNTKEVIIEEEWIDSGEYFLEGEKQLTEFFNGTRLKFDLLLNPKGTEFQRKVWHALEQVPYGEFCSYKDVAIAIGNPKASRAVGLANNRNPLPLIVPCHRVVGSSGKLVGYAYGLEFKKNLLEHELINRVFTALSTHYGDINSYLLDGKRSWWPAKDPFEMMVGAILTQNTNWNNVEKALANFNGQLTPQFIEEISHIELSEILRPSGCHNQKAKKLKNLTSWFKKYSYNIKKASSMSTSQLKEELLAIDGVGDETADAILVYALDKTSFVIDAYTRRIFSRIGIDVPSDYNKFREQMQSAVEPDVVTYDYYHGLVIEHAKAFCNKTPLCEGCPLGTFCQYN